MEGGGRTKCPVEGCDGDLYREFITGLNRSTAQMMRLAGIGLIAGPLLFGAPFLYESVARGVGGPGRLLLIALLMIVPIVAGVVLLRHRAQRLTLRAEQQRCNKCGTVFPPAGGNGS